MSRQHRVRSSNAKAFAWNGFVCLALCASIGFAAEQKPAWTTKDALTTPECAYFDPGSSYLFVSSVAGQPAEKDGNGYLSKFTIQGRLVDAKWITGLNAPKGMRAHRGRLWVADIQDLVEIDIKNKRIVQKITIPESKLLNDIAIGTKGEIYVSDTFGSKIFRIQNGKIDVFAEGEDLESPNGLLLVGDKLVVAAYGLTTDFSTKLFGRLYTLDLVTKKKTPITVEPLGNLDGLEIDTAGNYWVSDWASGKVFRISAEGKAEAMLSGFRGPADIGLISKQSLIVVPRMMEDTLTAYSIRTAK